MQILNWFLKQKRVWLDNTLQKEIFKLISSLNHKSLFLDSVQEPLQNHIKIAAKTFTSASIKYINFQSYYPFPHHNYLPRKQLDRLPFNGVSRAEVVDNVKVL